MKDTKEIAVRTLIQGALSFRSQMENHAKHGNERAVEIIEAHSKWLNNFSILSSMEDAERGLIESDTGSWDDDDIQECFWKIESFKALLWVLNWAQIL